VVLLEEGLDAPRIMREAEEAAAMARTRTKDDRCSRICRRSCSHMDRGGLFV